MARPGVRQTLRSVSNNVNKRASILRFYRPGIVYLRQCSRSRATRGEALARGEHDGGYTDSVARAKGMIGRRRD
jgi:hypothetical protein